MLFLPRGLEQHVIDNIQATRFEQLQRLIEGVKLSGVRISKNEIEGPCLLLRCSSKQTGD
jgi:hypothetical protein